VKYLGYVLTSEGLKPLESKVDAILNAPQLKSVSELKSFLGMINFYAKFVPNLASQMHPLYNLQCQSVDWLWSKECEQAFEFAKKAVASAQVLTHYDPTLPLVLTVDASPYGLGAALSHKMKDGREKPIAFASRSLGAAEKNYAQVEKEGLAIIFGVKKFHMYLFGRKDKFTLVTDHQPLVKIFGPKTNIPTLAAARMQRWALILAGYNYDIAFRKGIDNVTADMLSRFPVGSPKSADTDESYMCYTVLDSFPVTAKEIGTLTSKDPVLSRVYEFTLSGWPGYLNAQQEALTPFSTRKDELSIEDGCVLWGRRVIIPSVLQERVLLEMHDGHPGMVKMKALARSFVWWPGLDADIEDVVRKCSPCAAVQNPHKKVPLLLWPWTTEPWQRIHLDFLEVKGQMFFLVIDVHSKWLEVFPMSTTTSSATISVMRSLFARYGLPVRVVSDNGPQFISEEFSQFLKRNGIQHTLSPPYHASTNGQAESGVHTFKRMFDKSDSKLSLDKRVTNVLFSYRNLPHSTTGKTPSELFLKRSPRTRLSLLKPCLKSQVELKQERSKSYQDGPQPRPRTYDLYQPVRVRNIRGGREKWIPGTIVQVKGPSTYLVRVPGNNRRFVHADHLVHDDRESSIKPSVPNAAVETPVKVPPYVMANPAAFLATRRQHTVMRS
jgi:hypothetical protein